MRTRKRRSQKAGLPPGSLVHVGDPPSGPTAIDLVDYDGEHLREERVADLLSCLKRRDQPTVTWININNIHQPDLVHRLGEAFAIHPLTQEDILNADQRPKAEDFEQYVYVVFKMLTYDEQHHDVAVEQVSLVWGKGYVISFQEKEGGDVFDPVRERIRHSRGRIRRMGADYLAYALLDAVVDHYFVVLEKLEDRIEVLENELLTQADTDPMPAILRLKRDVLYLRHAIWPLREVVGDLQRGETQLISDDTRVFLKDVYDHVVHAMDVLDGFREMVAGMLEIHLSRLTHRLNEVVKVLTILTAVFIPLTFIVGVYGMNFQHMPELHWPWAYPALWALMIGLAAFMLHYFHRKKWL